MNVSLRTSTPANYATATTSNNIFARMGMPSFLRWFFVFMMVVVSTTSVNAQLTGTKNIPGDYATLTAAIADLNLNGVGAGGVTINLLAGNNQTAPVGGYTVGGAGTAILTSASTTQQVLIVGNGNTITAPTNHVVGSLTDAIFKIVGADWVTISGFTMLENAANTVTTAGSNTMTEFGVGLFYATTTNGAQNNTILNNTITLNRTYQNTFGIYSNSTHAITSITALATATTAGGTNSNLKIYGNAINNVNIGVVVVGPTAGADHNNGLDIGGTGGVQANVITNFGTTGTFSGYINVSGTVNGIVIRNCINANVSHNTIASSNGGTTVGTLNGIQVQASSNAPTATFTNTINNNNISIRSAVVGGSIVGITYPSGSASATSTLNINNNNFNTFGHTVASPTGTVGFISVASTNQFTTINNNTFTNISLTTTGSTTFISQSFTAPATGTKAVNGNTIVTGFSKTGAGGTVTLILDNGSTVSGAVSNCQNNNFSNITLTGATTLTGISYTDGGTAPTRTVTGNTLNNWTTGAATINCMNFTYWNGTSSLSGNTITNITGQGAITGITIGSSVNTATSASISSNTINNLSSTGTGGNVTGITCSNTSSLVNINSNLINTLSSAGVSTVTGIIVSGASTTNVFKNKVYDLSGSNSSSLVNGLTVSGGATVNVYNNLVGDLRATVANATNPIVGLNITGGTNVNAHFNTVNLTATSTGALFGSSAVSVSTTPTVTLRNNIFINTSSPNLAGLTVAYRRSTATLTSYGSASNNNLFYAGTPGPNNLIFTDGTNSDQAMSAYKARVASRDGASVSAVANFLSTTGSSAQFLHIDPTIATPIESGAATVSGVTDDFDGDTRHASAPDMGADEFAGIGLVACVAPTAQPTAMVLTAASATSMTINFTAASPAADAYLVVRSATQPTDPQDGTNYTAGASALGGVIVGAGQPPFTDAGLTANTSYTYWVYSYTAGTAFCSGPVYLIAGPLTGSATTCVVAPVSAAATNITTTGFDANWAAVAGATGYQLDVSVTSAFTAGTFVTTPVGAVTTYAVSGITSNTVYYYRVRAVGAASCVSDNSTTQTVCIIYSVPFIEGFEGIVTAGTLSNCMTASPTPSTSGKTRTYIASATVTNSALIARTGSKFAAVYWSPASEGYFFTSGMQLTGGVTYTASIWYKTDGVAWSTANLYYGTSATPAAMLDTIAKVTNAAATNYTQISGTFTPATSGIYYISFSAYNETTAPNYIAFDDFSVLQGCVAPPTQPTALIFPSVGPGSISGTFTATTPASDRYLTVIYPAGSAVTAPVDGTAYAAGDSLGLGIVIAYSSATSFLKTGLVPNTNYDIYVYAANAVNCLSGPKYNQTSPLTATQATSPCPTLPATITIGATGTYTTLGEAVLVLAGCGITQPTLVELQTDYVSSGETLPMVFTAIPGASAVNTVTIRPATGAGPFTLSGSSTNPIFDFNGLKYVTIDGRAGGTGTTKALSITNTGNGAALRLFNNAQHNNLQYVTFTASNTSGSNGVIRITGAADTLATSGNNNNLIDNCNINGNGVSPNGIYAVGSAAPADNKSNTISNNNIYDNYSDVAGITNYGILLAGANAVSANSAWTIANNSFYQTVPRVYNNVSSQVSAIGGGFTPGGAYIISGNYIGGRAPLNGGAALTLSGTGTYVFSPINLITGGADSTSITGNTFSNINVVTASTSTTTNSIIAVEPFAATKTVTITGNTIGSTSTPGSITFTGGASAVLNCINVGSVYTAQSGTSVSVTNNVIAGISIGGTTNANSITGIFFNTVTNLALTGASTISGNTIGSSTASIINPSAGSITGISQTHTIGATINNNSIQYLSGTTTGTAGQIRGVFASSGINTISANTIANNTTSTANVGTAASSSMMGISSTATTGAQTITNNSIHSLTTSGAGAVNMIGIYFSGSASFSNVINKNTVSNIFASSPAATGAVISGLHIALGSNVISNNFVRLGTSQTVAAAINGIRDVSGTNNYYYNTTHIGGTGVTAGTSNTFALNSANSGTRLFQNNIFSNTRANGAGTGKHYAITVAGTTKAPAGLSLSNNNYYATGAGTFGLYNANDISTFAAWKDTTAGLTGPALDLNSNSANPNFIDAEGAIANLHINTAIASPLESQGIQIAGITTDYDGDIRRGNAGYTGTGTSTDIGADEFEGTSAAPFISSGTLSPAASQCTAVPHNVTAVVVPGSAAITSVTLNYAYNGVAQTAISMVNSGGNNWDGTIPAATTPVNAQVTWNVTVVDGGGFVKVFTGASYSDVPLFGAVASATASINPICAGSPTVLTASLERNITSAIGTQTTTEFDGVYRNGFGTGDFRHQLLYTAAEMSAAGFSAGSIKSIQFNVTSVGGGSANNYTINLANTSATALTTTFITGTFTTCYVAPTYTAVAGNNLHTFTTPFIWDGTSNILVDICYNISTTGTTSTVAASTPAFTANVNLKGTAGACTAVGGATTYANRPLATFSANTVSPTGYSWSDGTNIVGTTNPLTVNPTATTTYTATIAASGCTATASVSLTVNPLPAAPSTVPSVQCGDGIPAAGAVGAGSGSTYRWYTTSTGGTPIQDDVSNSLLTYSISTTTTFYVSIFNGTCEGPRTSVVAQVNQPDAVTASATSNSVCLNGPVVLTATQSGSTNTYNYTWTASPAAGSGISGSITGTPVTITPTAAGVYTYTVAANDPTSNPVCNTSATVTVTIKALPVITVASATPDTICAGQSATLTATTPMVVTGTAAVGAGASSSSSSATPFYGGWGGTKVQYIYTAAELTAAGIQPGNITSLGLHVTAVGATEYKGFKINIGSTTQSVFASATALTGLTEVFAGPLVDQGYAATLGLNTFAFSTPYNWDGTSNIAVSFCYSNNNGSNPASTIEWDTYTGFNKSMYIYSDNQTPATVCGATTTIPASGGSSTSTGRPKTTFAGQVNGFGAGSLSWIWNPGALSGNTVSVTPSSTTSYIVTATDAVTSCSNTDTVEVFVNPLPPAPTGTDNTHCGDLAPLASVSSNSGAGTPVFVWYMSAVGGTPVQTSTSATFTGTVGTTTTWYVAELSAAGCESPRIAVTETVGVADGLTASAPASICLGAPANLSVVQTGGDNVYVFTWTASPEAGSGITVSTPGSPGATVTPTAAGTYIYTVTGFDEEKGCTAVSADTVIVNSLPQITTVTAIPDTICAGDPVVLTAQSIPVLPGSATLGAGALTSNLTGTPFYGGWGGTKVQYIYTAAQLTAGGINPGNITALSLDVTVAAATVYQGFALSIGSTTQSVFATPNALTGLTQVFTGTLANQGYTPTVGLNTFTFSTPFNWDGTSNIVVSFCYSNNNGSNTASTIRRDTYTGTNTTMYIYSDFQTPATMCAADTTIAGSGASAVSALRPKTTFHGQVTTNVTSSLQWVWNPGALAGSSVTVNPTVSTSYTATATNATTGCTYTSAPIAVEVNPIPAAPVATNSTQCGYGIPTASVTGSGGTFNWYDSASGGALLQAGGNTYTTGISTTRSFWVSETSAFGCVSPRTEVTVTVTQPDAVTASSDLNNVCPNTTIQLSVVQTGSTNTYTYAWQASPAAGSGITGTVPGTPGLTVVPTLSGTYDYIVTATDAGASCVTKDTVSVTMTALPVITDATATPATICSGASVNLLATTPFVGATSIALGAGAATSTAAGTPFYGTWGGTKVQYIYKASEMTAAGFVPGNITALGLDVTIAGATSYEGFAINIGATTQSTYSTATALTGLTQVFAGPLANQGYTPTVGVNMFTFTTPFNWDGTSNIVVSFCYSNNNGSNPASTIKRDTYTGGSVGMYIYADNQTPATVCGATTTIPASGSSATTTARPRTTFSGQGNTTGAGSYNWVWNPGNITGNAITVTPTTTTTYVVTATDPVTTCSNTDTVIVTVVPVTALASASPDTICAGAPVTLDAAVTGGAPFTYSWSDGTTVIGTTKTLTVNPNNTTTYTITVTDNCGNFVTSPVTVIVNPAPAAILANAGPFDLCTPATQTLSVNTNVSSPTYQWTLNGGNISGANAASYVASATGDYAVIVTSVAGCSTTSATATVTVHALPTAIVMTPTSATVCSGTGVTLNGVSGQNATTTLGTETTTLGAANGNPYRAGVATSVRTQILVLASELTTAGFTAGDITSLGFTCTTTTGTLANFTIKMGASSATALTSTFETSSVSQVFTQASFTPLADQVNVHTFQTPFNWNGTSNVLIDICQTNDVSGTSTVAAYTPGFGATSHTTGSTACTIATGSAVTARPLLTITANTASPITWSPATGLNTTTGNTVIATPATTTTYTATATNTYGCTISNTVTVTVDPLPVVSFTGLPSAMCSDASSVTLVGTPSGGTFSGTGITGDVFSPATAGAGAHVITYSYTDPVTLCTGTTTQTVTVSTAPAAEITYPATPYCSSGGSATVTLLGTTGGTYSSTAGLVINPSTGEVNLGTSTAGTYTVTYTIAAAGGCNEFIATTNISITAQPAATISYAASPYCTTAGLVAVSHSGTAGGTYTALPAGLTINPSTGEVDPSTSTPGTYTVTYTVAASGGCAVYTTTASITVQTCATNITLNLKMFFQGYYMGGGAMQSVLLNQGMSANALETDNITVELHDATTPSTIVATVTGMLNTDGTCSVTLPSLTGSYYIAIKHRNTVQTWSANPVLMASTVTYDFTTAANKAYGDNMYDLGDGNWAFYTGDINQDENIDLLDYPDLDNDILNFTFGYFPTDLNGDGNVDLIDYPIFDGNNLNFIFSNHPF